MSERDFCTEFKVALPQWAVTEIGKLPTSLPAIEDRMREVIRFSRLNFQHATGGPFAAGVFEQTSGHLLAMGVNRVIPENMSAAHAEIVALTLAQKSIQKYDLGSDFNNNFQLVVNARPCAMCFGAIPWSGIVDVVVGASGEDIESLTGFDEGPIHPEWKAELQKRGITVTEGMLRQEACEVLAEFGQSNSIVYNGRSGK